MGTSQKKRISKLELTIEANHLIHNSSSKGTVVHLIFSIEIGGAENQLLQLTRLQVETREVHVLYFSGKPDLFDDFIKSGIKVQQMPLKLKDKINLLNSFASSGAIIHTHLPHAEIFAALFLSDTSRWITTRHVAGPFSRRIPEAVGIIFLNFIVSRTKKVIAISNVVYQDIIRKSLCKKMLRNKMQIIYYGFSTEDLNPKLLSNIKYEPEKRMHIIGTISRLEEQKNLKSLIYAVASLNDYNLELRIVGDGSQKNELLSLVKKLRLEHKVKFLGKTKNVNEFLSGIDFFILPSKYEGFGIVLVEAAFSDTPIIVSDLEICREVLGDNGAIFFNPKSINDISRKIKLALTLYPLNEYRLSCKEHVSKFNLIDLISKTEKVYKELEK